VRLHGLRGRAARLFAQADVFVLPSRVEALPLCSSRPSRPGCRPVATDVGDVREALGGVVELVPPEDAGELAAALRRLLDDPGRPRPAQPGRDHAAASA
jgi:glycosyltransferase involved in cell wall biosynthesis